jgi:hypothetical protein
LPLSVEGQQLYSRSWRNAPTWRFGWLDHQPRYAAFLTPSPSFPHSSLGVAADGTKDILGRWIETTEGAKFWLKVMNELKARGVEDILIAVAVKLAQTA